MIDFDLVCGISLIPIPFVPPVTTKYIRLFTLLLEVFLNSTHVRPNIINSFARYVPLIESDTVVSSLSSR